MPINTEYEKTFVSWYELVEVLESGAIPVGINQSDIDPDGIALPVAIDQDEIDPKGTRLPVENGQSFDAFGRQEVSQITTQLDLKQSAGELTEFIDKVDVNGGSSTYNTSVGTTTLNVSANGDRVIHQTFQRTNYQTGKAKVIKMTFNGFQSQTDVIKRVGYFSADYGSPYETNLDGCWLESESDEIYTNVYANGVATSSTASGDWNGEDINGIDWSKNQLLKIEFAWLGVAAVKWSLFRNGKFVNFHTDIFDNTLTAPYMIFPNHPLRWEIQSDDGAGSFTYICSSAEIEGAENQLGKLRGIDRGTTHQNANSTSNLYANIGIALDETKAQSFRQTVVDIIGAQLLARTNDDFVWRLIRNPSISGTALSWNSVSNSGVKYFIGADDNLVTGGDVIQTGYIDGNGRDSIEVDNSIKLGVDLDGNPDVFVLAVQPITANLDILSGINWRELD